MYSDSDRIFTDMFFSAAAITAMTASKMTFTGNPFTDFKICDTGSHLFNITHIFMTNNHWCFYSFL